MQDKSIELSANTFV